MHGQFTFLNLPGHPPKFTIPNMIVDEGEASFLKMILQGNVVDVALGGNFYLGMTNQAPTETDILASITTEPGATGGYARKALARNAVDFPTLFQSNGVWGLRSKLVVWTPSAADYDTPFTRVFLCNVASGSVGVLFSYSGPLLQETTPLDGVSVNVYYELFLD